MPYYQRLGVIDRRRMTYGFGRFQPMSYKNHRGAEMFTDVTGVGGACGGAGNGFLHGRIYDPSELNVSPPFPEFVKVDGVVYQFNPNNRPPNSNQPFNPNVSTYNGSSTLSQVPKEKREISRGQMVGNRGMQGVGYNKETQGVNPGIYREKDQPEDDCPPEEQATFEQSSMLSQQLRRKVVKGERLLTTFNQGTGEIEEGGERAFIGDRIEDIKGNKNTFFLNPANRPTDGSHKDLSV